AALRRVPAAQRGLPARQRGHAAALVRRGRRRAGAGREHALAALLGLRQRPGRRREGRRARAARRGALHRAAAGHELPRRAARERRPDGAAGVAARRRALEAARSGRWVEACAWGLLALALGRLAVVVIGQLTFPLDLEFETLQLRTVRVIESGANPYGPETYASLPYVFSVYTPLYHLLVAALPEVAGKPFLVGRLLALGATLLVAAGFFLVDGRRTRPALAAFACGVFLLLWPVAGHAAYMRQEPLALLASAAAMLLLARSGARAAAGAAVCCLLALGFKQSFLAAPVAGLLYVALARRRREALAFGGVLVG